MEFKYILLSCIVIISLMGIVKAQSEPSVSEMLDSLPPELQGKVEEAQIQGLKNKSTEAFKEKCLKNGGPEAFAQAEVAYKEFATCLKSLVDPAVLQQEIEDAKPNGEIDVVFKKYCKKTPVFKGCFRNMTDSIKPCFGADERANFKTVYNVTEQLAEFVCFKEGDRIALFIAEGGPECYQEKQDEIRACVNSTLGPDANFDPSNLSADNIPKINFGEKECGKLVQLQECVVRSLESCEQPTSANIAESLFKFIRKATPCVKFQENPVGTAKSQQVDPSEPQKGSANALAVTSLTGLLAIVANWLV